MQSFRFHVVALPHTQTTKDYVACAYTQKVVKFCTMMKSLGHEVVLYASSENEAPCDELVELVSLKEQRDWFGDYDFRKDFFNIEWDSKLPYWETTNTRAIKEIGSRIKERDFICLIGGVCQKPIADAFPDNMSVEYGIGYDGVFSAYRIFESYAWMHYVQGTQHDDNGHFYDAVIPNYFDPKDFTLTTQKDDFFLFIGRFIERKGLQIAADITKAVGAKLVMAGQGVHTKEAGRIVGNEASIEGDHILHIGHVNAKQRDELMGRAKAVIAPSTYLEPFGGTSIEPLFCGTPVITTDWGAFPENIRHGEVGYRMRTLGEGIWAAKNLDKLWEPRKIRKYAIDNFSLSRVKHLYQAYFEQLWTLWGEGWHSSWDDSVRIHRRYR